MAKQEAAAEAPAPAGYPWYAVALTLLVAAALTGLLAVYASSHAAQQRRTMLAMQDAHLHQLAFRAQNNLAAAIQLVHVSASLLPPLRDANELREDLQRVLAAADTGTVSGVGVFFAPYVFRPDAKLDGFYVDRGMLARGTTYVLDDSFHFDYTRSEWFAQARAAGNRIAFTPPYFAHGHQFVSAVKAFYERGTFAGVVLVDSIKAVLVHNLSVSLRPGESIWVTDDRGRIIAAAGPALAGSDTSTLSLPLRGAPWVMHLTTDVSAASFAERKTWMMAVALMVLVWGIAWAIAANLLRIARLTAQTAGLRIQSAALRTAAFHDVLTGLPNRAYLLDTLARAITNRDAPFAVIFIDLDQFAVINDSLGHTTGDALLQQLAARVTQYLPPGAMLSRLGGDEFVVYVPGAGAQDAQRIAQAILDRLRHPFNINERSIYTGASMGVVLDTGRYSGPEELLRDADLAMYSAKEAGRSRYVVFDEDMHARALRRLSLESALRSAIEQSEFRVFYQPVIDIATGEVASIEALCRWDWPGHGAVAASDFISVAEQTGSIGAIDSFVLVQACNDAVRIAREFGPIPVAVNVSASRLTQSDLIASLSHALLESGLAPECLRLEITETAIMARPEHAVRALSHLRDLGVSIVIDDFGTGYSSLSYVQRLPIAGLKIDRSFITPMAADAQSAAIVRAVAGLAKTLDLHVTAEGVETPEQVRMLHEMGVRHAQGFFFAPALDYDELKLAIAERNAPVRSAFASAVDDGTAVDVNRLPRDVRRTG